SLAKTPRQKHPPLGRPRLVGCGQEWRGMRSSAPGAAEISKKFGLRTMKSLRKIAIAAITVFLVFAAYLAAQTPGQSTPATDSPQSPQTAQRPPAGPPP